MPVEIYISCSLIFNTEGTPPSYLEGQVEPEHIIQFSATVTSD
jgi:hypothetical protein